ncbi:uncharacterized protein LOC121733199 [Aricia agestis]|uniref:uncharacterized protein LOC121733199 n=1 Tax=Aricia agestis TaxID=91739 RepID=UPI001C2058E4|nr:uncharacterized protein LOC121733199 [Aricia agestis]
MGGIKFLIFVQLVYISASMEQLDIIYEWKQLDFQFPSPEVRGQMIENRTFVPENNIPMGVEVYGDKLFVTVPRWRGGVPASLTYVNLTDNSTKSPKLIPYPNWEAHLREGDKKPDIVSPFRVRADRCDRLWVLDSGKINSLNENGTIKFTPALIIFDLKTDTVIRRYTFPEDQVKEDSGFAVIAVEDMDCENTYAYAGDVGKAGLVVYSWAKNESWRIHHHFFNIDPMACEYSVKGHEFTWDDAIFGLSLAPNNNSYSTLYFHPMSSFNEFSVSTEYLRNESIAEANFEAFKLLGSRGPNAQSGVSFLDPKTRVLFYSLVNMNAVVCWRTTNKVYNMTNQGRIYKDDDTMVYPTDIKVDTKDTLWVLSNRLPLWMDGLLNDTDINFRVFSGPVLKAINHTACDPNPSVEKIKELQMNRTITGKCVKFFRGPNLLKTVVALACFALLVQQIASCIMKLIDVPVTTYTHFEFNRTVRYPSVTFCREPPYKYDKLIEYGLYSHPRFTSTWFGFNFSRISLDQLWEEITYDEQDFFVQYGLENLRENVVITSTLGFITGRCFTLSPRKVSRATSQAQGYSVTLQHQAADVATATSVLPPGYHVHVHYTEEPYTEVEVYNGGLVDYLYVNTGETVDIKLTVNEYVMISDDDDPCTDEPGYSANECTTEYVWREVGSAVGCSGPWMTSDLPPCDNFQDMRNLISTYINMQENHDSDKCHRTCRSLLYGAFVTDRQRHYGWNARNAAELQTTLYIHFNNMMVSVYEERHNYDWNLFLADLGGSVGFLLGLSVIGLVAILSNFCAVVVPMMTRNQRLTPNDTAAVTDEISRKCPYNKY